MKWIGIVLLAALQTTTDDPRSLRGNEMYTRTSFVMARDICSDHPSDTKVWILDYKSKHWLNVSCEQWALADK